MYQRRLLLISSLLMVLYTEISDQIFLYFFSSRFWSIKSCGQRLCLSISLRNSQQMSPFSLSCFGSQDEVLYMRRPYLIMGSTLFYKVRRPQSAIAETCFHLAFQSLYFTGNCQNYACLKVVKVRTTVLLISAGETCFLALRLTIR